MKMKTYDHEMMIFRIEIREILELLILMTQNYEIGKEYQNENKI